MDNYRHVPKDIAEFFLELVFIQWFIEDKMLLDHVDNFTTFTRKTERTMNQGLHSLVVF
ncbi:hypothetical protein D3C87_2188410 [compost metagenome]